MNEQRTASQLGAIFMGRGQDTCTSAEEYTAFVAWAVDNEVPVEPDVNPDNGHVLFTPAQASQPETRRELALLVTTLHERGSLVLTPAEYPELEEWVRANNVPVHRQIDHNLGRIVVIKRGWGTVEA